MRMHFTGSVIMAINFMDRITRPGHGVGFPQPFWTDFRFWSDIETDIVLPATVPEGWDQEGPPGTFIGYVTRDVTFSLRGVQVAVVTLSGRRVTFEENPPETSWAVHRIRYASVVNGQEATEWYDRTLPIGCYKWNSDV